MPEPHATPRLARAFYARGSLAVARDLLGRRVVRVLDGQRLSGLICETEAYGGPDDEASHAYRRTVRSAIMYGPPGFAYVYFVYGMHFCLNVVTEQDGFPGAVLIRGLLPQEGVEIMRDRRLLHNAAPAGPGRGSKSRIPDRWLTDGPGKVGRALGISAAFNGADLTESTTLFIETGVAVSPAEVAVTPRVGVRGNAEARDRPWRFIWQPARPEGSGLAPDHACHDL